MATLSEQDRLRIWRGIMRWWSNIREEVDFNKQNLKDAIDATDQWIDDNQASYNNSLPTTFRTNATLEQKTLLFCAVAAMRVSLDFLRRIFGKVD